MGKTGPWGASHFGYLGVTGSHFFAQARINPVYNQRAFSILFPVPKDWPVRRNPVRKTTLVLLLTLLASSHVLAMNARARTRHHGRRAAMRRVIWTPLLPGSHESLLRQNAEIDRLQLPRIVDDTELAELEASEQLVPIEETQRLAVASNLEPSRRYCRPWTRDFLTDLSEAYYQEFHRPLEVTSAVRTVDQQRRLRRHNRNAAPETGDTASSHLAGITVDILKRGMTRRQHRWIEQYFYDLKEQGLIEPEEERRQPVFHVMVSDRYTEWRAKAPAGLQTSENQ